MWPVFIFNCSASGDLAETPVQCPDYRGPGAVPGDKPLLSQSRATQRYVGSAHQERAAVRRRDVRVPDRQYRETTQEKHHTLCYR